MAREAVHTLGSLACLEGTEKRFGLFSTELRHAVMFDHSRRRVHQVTGGKTRKGEPLEGGGLFDQIMVLPSHSQVQPLVFR